MGIGMRELLILAATSLVLIFPMWLILRKAGHPPALSLLTVLPGGLIFLALFLAIARWPALEQSRKTSR
jgi:hypothetical protein